MTRLSDLLRGAAERAPMGEASVSLDRARRRIGVQRGVRGVANGLAGAGAAALILVGVIRPGGSADGTAAFAPEADAKPAGGDRFGDASYDSALMPEYYYWWGQCGSYPIDSYAYDTASGLTLRIDSDGWTDLEGGGSIDVPVVLDASMDANVRTIGSEAAVLYQGMIVAYVGASGVEEILDLTAGDAVDSTLTLPLVNCWDGLALPAGQYEVVVSESFTAVTDEPSPEPANTPTTQPLPEPSAVPEPQPNPSVSANVVGEAGIGDAGVATTVAPIERIVAETRVISTSVSLTIAGDAVENPFGPYVEVWTPPALPGDVLTPAVAREIWEAAATVGTWDMAPGTSRWIAPNYGDGSSSGSARMAAYPVGWYGCSWDGTAGQTFPTTSADLDLLDVTASVPSRIHLSYGWVVDDNPVIEFSVTNTSGYSLPGFYGEPAHNLYLVKDGRVVAEAYPVNTNPYNPIMYMDTVPTPEEQAAADLTQYWGILSPDATTGGTYLWRDITGCWLGERQATVAAGTYTVVTMQSLYLQSETPLVTLDGTITSQKMGDEEVMAPGMAEPAPGDPVSDVMIDPYYYPQYDYLELQVWTSLGTVIITTN